MNFETAYAFWTIVVSLVPGLACALLGCFLLLKRMSLLTDAISHGMIPGIALSVIYTGSLSPVGIMVGAIVFGWLTAWLTQFLASSGKVTEDSSLGIVFTVLFAFGLILIKMFLAHSHIDPGCVFYGALETAWRPGIRYPAPLLDTLRDVPHSLPGMAVGLGLTLAFLVLLWKELKLATFDPALAEAMGFRPRLIHYLLVGLVALNTVTAFEAVGAVMVLAMFTVPAACARLFSDRLPTMLVCAAGIAVVASLLAYPLADRLNTNVAGMIAVVLGAEFALALLVAPRYGLLAQGWRRLQLTLRIAREEILATLYRRAETGLPTAPVLLKDHGLAPLLVDWASRQLVRHGYVTPSDHGLELTEAGRLEAASVVRAHRLWETYLEKNFGLPLNHLHEPASEMEHFLGPKAQQDLTDDLQAPPRDPHGKEIPGK